MAPVHATQAPPPLPQTAGRVPTWQVSPAQQPSQLVAQGGGGEGGGGAMEDWQVAPSQTPVQHCMDRSALQLAPTGMQSQIFLPAAVVVKLP